LPFRDDLTLQHGFVAAAIVAAIVDVACGYAAMSLMAPGAGVLTVEFKLNLLAPAVGERFIARGRVTRAGRLLSVCAGDVFAVRGTEEKPVATMLATMMSSNIQANAPRD
jgi:acyl-coenzyme A thioesterase PaaI-like protein